MDYQNCMRTLQDCNAIKTSGLKNNIAWLKRRGYAWVRNHLFKPAEYIISLNRINSENVLDLFEAYYFGADDAYLIQDFARANRLYQRCLHLATHESNQWKDRIDWEELFDDLAVTYCLIGHRECLDELSILSGKYCDEKLDVHFYDDIEKCDDNLFRIRNLLCTSRPDLIITEYSDSLHDEIYLLTTIAYAQLGREDIFYERFSSPLFNVNLFTEEHAFYIPRPYYDRSQFWEIFMRRFPKFDFGAVYGSALCDRIPANEYLNYNYWRTTGNYDELAELYRRRPQWKELEFLLQYHSVHSKMPSWKELAAENKSPWY